MDGASHGLQDPMVAPSTTVMTPTSSVAVNAVLQNTMPTGIASVLPKHLPATCPLDQILLDFMQSRRALAARGVAMDEVVGPNQPYFQGILNPQTVVSVHVTSRVLAEIISTFSHVELPEKLAFMSLMFLTMRVRTVS